MKIILSLYLYTWKNYQLNMIAGKKKILQTCKSQNKMHYLWPLPQEPTTGCVAQKE